MHLLGWRSDTGALLAAADLLVCPSRHEPLGNVVIEAWSAAPPGGRRRGRGAARADHRRARRRCWCRRRTRAALADAIASLLDDPGACRGAGRRGPAPLRRRARRGARGGALAAVPRHRGEALMCGIAGLILRSGRAAARPGRARRADRRAGASRPGRHRPHRRRPRRAGAQPAVDHRPGDRRPAAVRRPGRRWSAMARSTTTASCARRCRSVSFATNSDCEPPLHLWLRDGAGLRAAPARHVRHRDPRARAAHGDADARPVRHQAALHRADRRRPGLRLGAAGAAGGRAGVARGAPGGARGAAAAAVHHRRRDDLRGHPAACCPARRSPAPTATCWIAAACRTCPRAGRRTSTRTRRWPGSIARWRRASICTSAATCPTACSSPAASTAPRCSR